MDVYELEGCSIESPVFCNHRRGKNWAAIMTGKNAANAQRSFLLMKGNIVDLSEVKPGNVVEFGGDYVTSSGRRQPDRQWWVVHVVSDESITVEAAETLAAAIRAARLFNQGKEARHG